MTPSNDQRPTDLQSESDVESEPIAEGPAYMNYYSLRITVDRTQKDVLFELLSKYSKKFCMFSHVPHPDADEGERNEHWHVLFLDLDRNKVDAMRKALRLRYDRSGNAFMAGKFMDNFIYKGIQYCRHDPAHQWNGRGVNWQQLIDDSPEWEQIDSVRPKGEPKKEKMSLPTLSHHNVIKQAMKWRQEHNIKSDVLSTVLEHMTRHGWQPDLNIMRRGLDPLHHQLFKFYVNRSRDARGEWFSPTPTPNWWTERVESRL